MLKIWTLRQNKYDWDKLDEMLTALPRFPSKNLVIATVRKWLGEDE